MSSKPTKTLEHLAGVALLSVLAAATLLGACAGPPGAFSAARQGPAEQASTMPPRTAGQTGDNSAAAAAHQASPTDPDAALAHARGLRANNGRLEALAVLDRAAAANPTDRRLQLERGMLALELGDAAKAEKLLRQAHDPKAPDWRLHSALGAALASRGKQQEAQAQFAKALALAPDQPGVLNNLALSYALDGKVEEGEKLMRLAARSPARPPQVQENLALVLGLRGRYEEARSAAQVALTPAKADENVTYLRELSQARTAAGKVADTDDAAAGSPARSASAGLPQPTYQLGASRPAE